MMHDACAIVPSPARRLKRPKTLGGNRDPIFKVPSTCDISSGTEYTQLHREASLHVVGCEIDDFEEGERASQ